MTDRPEYTPLSAVLPRLYWMVFGNIILLLTAVTTMLGSFQNLAVATIMFWVNASCMVIVRYVDIRFLRGETVDSQTATLGHWKKYTVSFLAGAALTWALTILLRVFWN